MDQYPAARWIRLSPPLKGEPAGAAAGKPARVLLDSDESSHVVVRSDFEWRPVAAQGDSAAGTSLRAMGGSCCGAAYPYARYPGVMHLYLNCAREHWTMSGENPPVGLILCAEKDGSSMRITSLHGRLQHTSSLVGTGGP